jgi:hypothetical protein
MQIAGVTCTCDHVNSRCLDVGRGRALGQREQVWKARRMREQSVNKNEIIQSYKLSHCLSRLLVLSYNLQTNLGIGRYIRAPPLCASAACFPSQGTVLQGSGNSEVCSAVARVTPAQGGDGGVQRWCHYPVQKVVRF